MVANLTTPLLGIVSTMAIGRLGDAALLGGVALASVTLDCVLWLFGFLRMGTVALTAQALGAGDHLEVKATPLRGLILAAGLGILLAATGSLLASPIFIALGGSAAVVKAAALYFAIRLLAAPFTLGNLVLLGWFVGQARMKIALGLQVGINLVNIALTLLFVLGLDLGIAGAALAAVIAEVSGFAAGALIAWGRLRGMHALPPGRLLDRARLTRMLAINRDIMIRTALLIGAFLMFTARSAREGDVVLAANSVLNNVLMIGSFFLDGLALSAEQLCGLFLGARDRAGFARAVVLVRRWSLAFGAALTLAFLGFGTLLIDALTTSAEVRQAAREALVLAALGPGLGALAYCYDGVFIGAGWASAMRNLMLAAFGIFLTAFVLLTPYGNAGLWWALLIFLAARGLLQMARYPALLRSAFAPVPLTPATARP